MGFNQPIWRIKMLNNRIHLRRLSVHGFKSLGQNGAGKSTILQIFIFIHAFMSGEPLRFFEERAWLVETIKPKALQEWGQGIFSLETK